MSTTLTNVRVYEPGRDISAVCTADVVGKSFVAISGDRTGGNLSVATAGAGAKALGVAAHAAATGQLVRVCRGGVVKVVASGAVAANAEVQVAAAGKAATKATGVAVGFAVAGAADGDDAEVALY